MKIKDRELKVVEMPKCVKLFILREIEEWISIDEVKPFYTKVKLSQIELCYMNLL